jgi:hypothetical protein
MTHHLQVVSPEDLVAPAIHLFAVDFLQLRWVILRRGERALAAPVEHGVALDRLELVLLDVGDAAIGVASLQVFLSVGIGFRSFVVVPKFPILVVAVGAHIAVLAQLGRASRNLVVLPLDARHDVIELRDGLGNSAVVLGK